jgi:DNA uptake protein ComE-like DNA-binding protein
VALLLLRRVRVLVLGLPLLGITACTNHRDNPDEIRRRTAEATETMRRDAQAVAEGVKEGMGHEQAININRASREDLLSLPGLTEREANRIIADRPFQNTHDLVTRHAVSEEEYGKIRDRVIAGH